MANRMDYVDLGLTCAHVCKTIGEALRGRRLDELHQFVLDAIKLLTT